MQMTGYMFKSAEYRMNFIRSLKGFPRLPAQSVINNPEVCKNPMYDCYDQAATHDCYKKVEYDLNVYSSIFIRIIMSLYNKFYLG
jgi:hypothetical protein